MAKLSQQCQRSNIATKMNNNSIGVTKVKRTRKTVPRDSPPQRSSIYRGVTRHRWTGRYEAHLWDKNCWNESQNKKGRQVYLGAYDDEDAAAHAYDLAALKYWGQDTILNFPLLTYQKELKEMEGQSREEYIGSLRRTAVEIAGKAVDFLEECPSIEVLQGIITMEDGKLESAEFFGNKYLYLGTYATQEEAAVAYDMAAIEYRGLNAVTNFDLSRYIKWLRPDHNNSHPADQPSTNPNPNVDVAPITPSHDQAGLNFPLHQEQLPQLSIATDEVEVPVPHSRPTTATSALGLLLQSSKFKEMMEMTTAAECTTSTPLIKSDPPQSSFPDEIQTHFETHSFSSNYGGGDDFIFGDINTFMHNMLQSDFDT